MPNNLENNISEHAQSSTTEGLFVELLADEVANAKIVIETDHERIHRGQGFDFSDYFTGVPTGISYILLKPNGASMHLRLFNLHTDDSPVIIEFFKDPTGTADGVELAAPINRNQYSDIVSPSRFYTGPTVTADGTRLAIDVIDVAKKDTGQNEGIALEWVLRHDTVYLIKVTNNAGTTINQNLHAFWYHPTL